MSVFAKRLERKILEQTAQVINGWGLDGFAAEPHRSLDPSGRPGSWEMIVRMEGLRLATYAVTSRSSESYLRRAIIFSREGKVVSVNHASLFGPEPGVAGMMAYQLGEDAMKLRSLRVLRDMSAITDVEASSAGAIGRALLGGKERTVQLALELSDKDGGYRGRLSWYAENVHWSSTDLEDLEDVTGYAESSFESMRLSMEATQVEVKDVEKLGVYLTGKVPGLGFRMPSTLERRGATVMALLVEPEGDTSTVAWIVPKTKTEEYALDIKELSTTNSSGTLARLSTLAKLLEGLTPERMLDRLAAEQAARLEVSHFQEPLESDLDLT